MNMPMMDKAVNDLYNTFYSDGVLKTFEKTEYTKQNFLSALILVYGEMAYDLYDIFIQDAIKSGYCS